MDTIIKFYKIYFKVLFGIFLTGLGIGLIILIGIILLIISAN